MRIHRIVASRTAVAAMMALALVGCGSTGESGSPGAPADLPAAEVGAGVLPAAEASAPPSVAAAAVPDVTRPAGQVAAPTRQFAVGTRQLSLSRGANRPLRTVLWYPATGSAGGAVRNNATPAQGRFPLVIFSHGLTSSPEAMQSVTVKLAAAGFVVAAPAYPFTSNGAPSFNPGDMANQPADASVVITEVLKLDKRPGDALAGHLDPDRVGAGGHSAGGFTTAGMLSGSARDNRVRAGIIISGGPMGQFSGPATPVLLIHGDQDAVVKYSRGRAAYDSLTWPKAFVTLIGGDHISPVTNAAAMKTMIDFLRWTLYGDEAAKARLSSDATVSGKSRFESSW